LHAFFTDSTSAFSFDSARKKDPPSPKDDLGKGNAS